MNLILQPNILRWARERAGLSVEQLARKVGTQPRQVLQWEDDGELPLKLVEKIAQKTHTPFGYLYLDTPPEEPLPITDFRTVGSGRIKTPSLELVDTLNRAIERQEWFRDYAISNDIDPLDFVGSLNGNESVEPTAQMISKRFSLETASRSEASTIDAALKSQCERLEIGGILVMKSSVVGESNRRPLSVDEFRGFALSDEYAPLIFVNSRDVKVAQIFTLMHELVHIWLGLSGVSNLDMSQSDVRGVEKFCNSIAAEILVPANELRQKFHGIEALTDLCHFFKVSTLVMLRRLFDLELIGQKVFAQEYSAALARFREPASDKGSGGDYYRTKISRLGRRFISALLESTFEGNTGYGEAFRLLGVRNAEKMVNLAKELKFDTP